MGSSHRGSAEMNLTSIHEDARSIPGLSRWVWGSGTAVSCGIGPRCGSDAVLLWLWHMLTAIAQIQPLAWEPPYAAGVALKRTITTTTTNHWHGTGVKYELCSLLNWDLMRDKRGREWSWWTLGHLPSNNSWSAASAEGAFLSLCVFYFIKQDSKSSCIDKYSVITNLIRNILFHKTQHRDEYWTRRTYR